MTLEPLLGSMETEEIAALVFLDIAVIVIVARLMGSLFRRIRQPAVVGEIIAGILLGPTLLGQLPGDLTDRLFPSEVRPYLTIVAELGLIIFMFIVGLELDLTLIRGKERVAAVISVSSVALPFGLGILLALGLHGSHDIINGEEVEVLPFALFIGASMAVTAFPVLARILAERGMYRTEVGALTLACAAVDDILAWSLLALVIAIVAAGSLIDLPLIFGMSVLFIGFMFIVVKPLLARINDAYRKAGRLTPTIFSVVLVGILLSSYATSRIGIHAIFGAFLFGVIMPRNDSADLTHSLFERLEGVSVVLLLPVFFIVTGLSVNVPGIDLVGLGQLALILLVACTGKFFGAATAARLQGVPGRKAAAIGILMNTRGLTELVILNIGLQAGVLTEELFTLLVLMAVLTTVMTEPLLRLAYPDRILQRDIEEAEKAALGVESAYRVLVPVDDPSRAGDAATVAASISASVQPSEVVLVRLMDQPEQWEIGSGLGAELILMTESMEALHELGSTVERRGGTPVVRSQFTTDPVADLSTELALVEPEMLVVAADDDAQVDALRSLVEGAEIDIAFVLGAGTTERPGVVSVEVDDGPSSGAAVEVATRVAAAHRARLVLAVEEDAGRRADREVAQLLERLADLGIDAAPTESADGDGGALVVVPLPAAWTSADLAGLRARAAGGPATVVAVQARPALARESGVDRLGKIELSHRSDVTPA